MDIIVALVLVGLVMMTCGVPFAGAMAGIEDRQKRERRAARPVLDCDAPLEPSEKTPTAEIGVLMAELARDGAERLLRERS